MDSCVFCSNVERKFFTVLLRRQFQYQNLIERTPKIEKSGILLKSNQTGNNIPKNFWGEPIMASLKIKNRKVKKSKKSK